MKMYRKGLYLLWGTLTLGVQLLSTSSAWAQCRSNEVSIRANTPIRKGPGLNYQVAKFLEKPTCARLEQVSVDGNWTLVQLAESFGWVLTERLSEESQALARQERTERAPIGTGIDRQFAQVSKSTSLREAPSEQGRTRRVLPVQSLVLPLRLSGDEQWVEVRDSRGSVGWVFRDDLRGHEMAGVPPVEADEQRAIMDRGMAESEMASAIPGEKGVILPPSLAEKRIVGPTDGVKVRLAAYGGTFIPLLRLASNGASGLRRYNLTALSAGAGVDAQLYGLGSFTARVHYGFGLVQADAQDQAATVIGGTSNVVYAMLGWAISTGIGTITPELGYAFESTDVDSNLPDSGVVFISSQTNAGLAGFRYQTALSNRLYFEANAAFLAGPTTTAPVVLGVDGGLAIGGQGGFGLEYVLSDSFGINFQYRATGWSAEFTGLSGLDDTISQAIITEIRQSILLGISYGL